MVKHTQTIRWQKLTHSLNVFDLFVVLALKWLNACFRFERGGLASVGIRTYPTVKDRAKDFSLSLVNEWLECFLAALETYCWIFGEKLLPSADLLVGGLLISTVLNFCPIVLVLKT